MRGEERAKDKTSGTAYIKEPVARESSEGTGEMGGQMSPETGTGGGSEMRAGVGG